MRLATALLALCTLSAGCAHVPPPPAASRVRLGVEELLAHEQYLALIRGKRVGLITNQTGLDSQGRSIIDLLANTPGVQLTALFGPEHGLFGTAGGGDHVGEMVHPALGIPIHSLYGQTRRPTREWLGEIDVMLYDIQDIGSRGFTYISTLAYAMDACGEAGVPFIVLDRPNPCGGDVVDGNILKPEDYSGFVGLYPIPFMYGLTAGETARMFNAEFNEHPCDLTVVPMAGWRRSMRFWDTGLPWTPSTSIMVSPESCFYELATGIIGEIRAVSIGIDRGTPFQSIAAPFLDGDALAREMNARQLPGIRFVPIEYQADRGLMRGIELQITDWHAVRPVQVQAHLMEVLNRLCPNQIFDDANAERWLFDECWGDFSIRRRLLAGESAESLIASWQPAVDDYLRMREQYLIYE
ncbi:MAG: DUF1343 domain-containing protein [Candidatus Sumerlaeia bacterium]|nr:DUF1343 domain-containing protein [Candidatus Sumerlaeia bacterium]